MTLELAPVGHAPVQPAAEPRPRLLLGEVRTALLQNSVPLTTEFATDLMRLAPDARVRVHTRPQNLVISPDRVSGVHCLLPTLSGSRVDAVGTVTTRALLTGGRVLQASAHALVADRDWAFRPPWSFFLARPGLVHARARSEPADIASGHLRADADRSRSAADLDLGALAGRLLDQVQASPSLDRRAGLRALRTRVRFAVPLDTTVPADRHGVVQTTANRRVELVIHDDVLRSITVTVPGADPAEVVRFCEDLALHDWLLTTVNRFVDGGRGGSASGEDLVARLRPVVTHLLPLWMPAAFVSETLAPLWASLEVRPGFSRQWRNLVDQIRDQLSLSVVGLLSYGAEGKSDRQ